MPELQNYENHAYRATAWTVAWCGAVFVTGLFLWVLYRDRSLLAFGLVVLGFLLLLTLSILRLFVVRLQDRIIRLEMRVRLARLGRESDIDRLTVKQLVALRFGSDRELAALLDRAIGEKLSPDQIKRAVTEWQADHLRT
jgi:hypothetical protein